MARTKASVATKVSAGKSSKARCATAGISKSKGSSKSTSRLRYSGPGNRVCRRAIPEWQRPISDFFPKKDTTTTIQELNSSNESDISSAQKPIKLISIESSDDDSSPEKSNYKENPENNKNVTTALHPTGENRDNMQDFNINKNAKGKGIGKKTKLKHADNNSASETVSAENVKVDNLDANSNGSNSSGSTHKGKGIGKKTKMTKYVNNNNVSVNFSLSTFQLQ